MRIKTFYIILVSLIIFLVFKFLKTPLYDVSGKAIILRGIQNQMYEDTSKIIPISGAKVLSVRGKVFANHRKQSIPISKIKSPKKFSLTNNEGIFKFKLPKGEYTFFILIEDQAYLNSFDGKDYFSSKLIDSNINNIVIIDTRGVLY